MTGTTGGGMVSSLRTEPGNWPTPVAADDGHKVTPASRQAGLIGAAANWSSPRASDGEKGGPNQSFGAGGEAATGTKEALSRPGPETSTAGASSRTTLLNAYLRCRATTDSALRSEKRALVWFSLRAERKTWKRERYVRPALRRQLSPIFVEWLMGWPPGWTTLARGDAPTGFACSATALSLWRRRMRSELWQLGSPHEAPPEQRSLFG